MKDLLFSPVTSDTPLALSEQIRSIYPLFEISVVGESFYKKPLVALSVGNGKSIFMFGAHHALEGITANLLFLFARRLAQLCSSGRYYGGINVKELFFMRRLIILPLVNPDGADIHSGLCDPTVSPFKREAWQANARGVDLNHNYPFGFYEYKAIEDGIAPFPSETKHSGERPLSEPESAAVARLIESEGNNISCILSLHTQGEEIYAGSSPSKSVETGGNILARLSGYHFTRPVGSAAYGGLCDYTLSLGIPSYTVECGRGKNPLPLSDLHIIYSRIEPLLFGALTLI